MHALHVPLLATILAPEDPASLKVSASNSSKMLELAKPEETVVLEQSGTLAAEEQLQGRATPKRAAADLCLDHQDEQKTTAIEPAKKAAKHDPSNSPVAAAAATEAQCLRSDEQEDVAMAGSGDRGFVGGQDQACGVLYDPWVDVSEEIAVADRPGWATAAAAAGTAAAAATATSEIASTATRATAAAAAEVTQAAAGSTTATAAAVAAGSTRRTTSDHSTQQPSGQQTRQTDAASHAASTPNPRAPIAAGVGTVPRVSEQQGADAASNAVHTTVHTAVHTERIAEQDAAEAPGAAAIIDLTLYDSDTPAAAPVQHTAQVQPAAGQGNAHANANAHVQEPVRVQQTSVQHTRQAPVGGPGHAPSDGANEQVYVPVQHNRPVLPVAGPGLVPSVQGGVRGSKHRNLQAHKHSIAL